MAVLKNKHHTVDPVWHLQLTMLVALALQLALPDNFAVGARYAIPVVEALLLLMLSFTTPRERIFKSLARRVNVLLLILITSVANAYALIGVARQLLQHHVTNGRGLILISINIFLTNIIIFALWYWEMDGGGPGNRQRIEKYDQDFLFSHHQHENYKHPEWKPTFVDYFYLSSTNALTFGPADTVPLSRRAKILMTAQATLSLVTVALVVSRAVNILT